MKAFDYPVFDVQIASAVPTDSDAVLEWREHSALTAIASRDRDRDQTLGSDAAPGAQWAFVKLKEAATVFERLTQARKAVSGAWQTGDQHLTLVADSAGVLDALLSAALAALYTLPTFKQDPAPASTVNRITLVGPIAADDVKVRCAEAEGNALTRFLSTLPANELTPWSYREWVEDLAEAEGWDYRVYDYKELEQMGAGAFLAVAQGSESQDASIVRVQYRGKPESTETLALVGKGVCFDTGGYNLKVSGSMFGMHGDMGGSAVVLGSLLTATRLGLPFNMTGWLALVANHLGPNAYHANQVVRALNGTTIEVVDTDAEGRMILADTLTLATRERPQWVFDYATLTGTCMAALSTRYSGVFTNHDAWWMPLIGSGQRSGERVWPFPIDPDYDEQIKSDIADIQQCNPGKSSDHIDAARFLSRFVEAGVPWVHLDLAADSHKGGLGHVPSDVTGFGIRLTRQWLQDWSSDAG
ncbi:leucyl aminopeptidase family protein [Saccharospirillum sp.]|uniref:leucyl aminopeptidase family protein n=1 Tax=Saccharospirillum sp. TaxID=2033801 RepID=UPI00349FF786